MKSFIPRIAIGLLVTAALVVPSVALAQPGATVPNWAAPATYRPAHGAITTMGDVTNPLPFIGVTPCRLVDTRITSGYTGAFGPPAITGGTSRNIPLPTSPNCPGLPTLPRAYSLNITATNPVGPGFIKVWPQGGTEPLVSTLNYLAGQTVANAAIVPAGTGGGISVKAGVSTTDVIIDINGYYGDTLGSPQNPFVLINNSTAETMNLVNNSTSCSSWCGIKMTVGSGWALYGLSSGIGTASAGVYGQSDHGVGVFGHSDTYNGVWAEATTWDAIFGSGGRDGAFIQGARHGILGSSTATTGIVYGVSGGGVSPDTEAAGVQGVTNQALANAGRFENSAIAGGVMFLSTQISGVNYSVWANARIHGPSLDITGSPKNFVAPHPLDPSKEIRYASVEAPTVDVYFRGTARLSKGSARIEVPDHFRFTAREGTYMTTLTPVGRPVSLSVESEGPDGIEVRGSGDSVFHYVVYAERAEIEGFEPVQKNTLFTPEALEKGRMIDTLPATTKALLVKNGTLNPDGTYNQETARAMGWKIPERTRETAPQR